ncbi:hypothetical protein [Microbulbifer sp. JMSA008]|uniref:hypothetical protein n=1 Tax=Microbulbifer sp. JMSA008 TaxID=3243373 RepID=UPI004039C60E
MLVTSSTAPAEDALRSYERHQDSLPDEGATQKAKAEDRAAEFFLNRILTKEVRLSETAANCHSRFTEIANNEFDEDSFAEIFRLALLDACEAGYRLQKIAKQYALSLAEKCREDLEVVARETGYLDEWEGF